jgi:hypothetical protein
MYYFKKLTALVFILLVTSACGPMYNTTYQYIPPQSFEGKQCLNNCMTMKQTCKNNCASQKNSCITTANITKLASQLATRSDDCEPARRSCSRSCEFEKSSCQDFGKSMGSSLQRFGSCSDTPCKSNCEHKFRVCSSNNRGHTSHSSNWECDDSSCQSSCSSDYNQCFTNCGGQIIEHTTCIRNCDRR